ncbi:MAG: glycosyltransferase, partial [Candidatus Eisenbacteria bacterium]
FIDDASPNPQTWPTLQRLAAEAECVRAIRLTRNFGQSAALLCGLSAARGDYIVTMDDDLQHPPEEIPRLIAAQEHDVVFGRYRKRRHGLFDRLTSRVKSWFDWLILRKPFHIQHSSFLLLRREVIGGILAVRTPFPLLSPMIYHATRDVVNVEVEHCARGDGRSGYTFAKRLSLFSNLIINNSAFLLTLIGVLGVSVSFLAIFLFLFYLGRRVFFGVGLSGWTSLMLAVLGIGGVLLFSIGVIGTYLVRIIQTSESRPGYVVRYDSAGAAGGALNGPRPARETSGDRSMEGAAGLPGSRGGVDRVGERIAEGE